MTDFITYAENTFRKNSNEKIRLKTKLKIGKEALKAISEMKKIMKAEKKRRLL